MNVEKQIEEMARVIKCDANTSLECPETTCGVCRAKRLYNAGYRKASDVAREIFEEIEGVLAVYTHTSKSEDYDNGIYDALEWVDSKVAELKKKYESEGENK